MNKILITFFTLLICLTSSISWGEELEGKGLLCYNKGSNGFKKDIHGIHLYNKGYPTYDSYSIMSNLNVIGSET